MSDQVKKNPVIKQGWLRVLLFGVCFFIVTLLIAIPAILAIAGTSPQQLENNLVPTISALFTGNYLWLLVVLELAISLVSVCILRFFIDRRSFISLGWDLQGFTSEGLTGLLIGPAILGLTSVLLLLSGHLEWTDIVWDPNSLFISLGLMVLIAFSEELVFRGYILSNLLKSFPNRYIALAVSAFLFACF
ncbi:MAG TPA: CPBP family intramembrane glutamic endopeptidase, partial [Puia sp.]|nr:CPBP family intramembrane glutamic endopeptidase [Puia sp.]